MKTVQILLLGVLFTTIFLLYGCNEEESLISNINPVESADVPNILLIIADDMGKDATDGFSEGNIKPTTPTINCIKDTGVSFENCWVYPTCTPTRSSIITGKYGYRTGVKWAGDVMSTSETILQKYIAEETNNEYATAIIGKWHLSGDGMIDNPENFGLDYYAGITGGGVQNYFSWPFTEDEVKTNETEYSSKKFIDLSIDWIEAQNKSWFLWLAFNAPHTPFHVPPSEMHSQGELEEYVDGMDPMPYYMAAIEAMDYQIARLLDSLSEKDRDNTVIIFIGDNGTPNQVAQLPYTSMKAKGSLYQGGINTPLYITGKNVSRSGEVDNNLITSTDLFTTIAEIAGVSVSELHDSRSFKPLLTSTGEHRDFQYSERKSPNQEDWAISNGEYKLIINIDGDEEMYKLSADPYENENLLDSNLDQEAANAKILLENELLLIRN